MKFYIVTNNLFDDSQFAYAKHRDGSHITGNAKKCEECGSFLSMLEWLSPLEVDVSKRQIGDFVFGSHVGFIVSKKFKEKFENTKLRSLDPFRKVDLYFEGQLLDEDYFYPNIPLIHAFVNLGNIEFDDEELCMTCQKGKSIISKINSIEFIEPNSIQEDIFFTSAIGQGVIVLSENFKSFIESENFKNFKLIEASKFKWDSLNPN